MPTARAAPPTPTPVPEPVGAARIRPRTRHVPPQRLRNGHRGRRRSHRRRRVVSCNWLRWGCPQARHTAIGSSPGTDSRRRSELTANLSQHSLVRMTPQEGTVSREKLKRLIDELSDQELHAVGRYVCSLHLAQDPVAASLAHVPVDDEPVTDGDLEAITESDEDIASGRVVTLEELRRELGA